MSQKLRFARSDRSHLVTASKSHSGEATVIAEDSDERVVALGKKEKTLYFRVWKRSIDVAASSLGLLLLSPLLVIAGILVKCTSRGPMLYWQDRVGRDGRHFRIAK